MPLYRGTVYKRSALWGESWSNVYTIQEANVLEALDVLNAIEGHEVAVHYNTVTFYRVHVVNIADKTDQRSAAYNDVGDLDPTGLGGPLPLFNTTLVRFLNASSKPELKFLRTGANEANLTLGHWDGDYIAFLNTAYTIPLVALTGYVGPSGEAHLSGAAESVVQNRQLGWHRRTRPGFRRGWVPA